MIVAYWRAALRFALRGEAPGAAADVPLWALCLPYRLWNTVVRHDDRTFEDLQLGTRSSFMRRVLPLRTFYLAFLFAWPLVAMARALRRGRAAGRYLRLALTYPELAVFHPHSDYTDREARWTRPDFSIAMYYAWRFHRTRDDFFALDDKRRFLDACTRHGLPTPPTFTLAEAIARGGEFIAKDPARDLGFGVVRVTADELREAGDEAEGIILQAPLRNHETLLRALPDDAPLCSFRVITLRHPESGELRVSRCAIRIGRAGAVADNTAQGGVWAQVDRETGEILPGVTKKTFGTYHDGEPVRFAVHADTGRRFAGLRVPWFDEGRRLALDAHRTLAPDALTLGWDIALAAERPVLLEVNVWTTCYDYDPPDDAFSPVCEAIARAVGGSTGAVATVPSAGP